MVQYVHGGSRRSTVERPVSVSNGSDENEVYEQVIAAAICY